MSAKNFSASASMTAHDFVAPARIAGVLPSTTVCGGFAATLPAIAGGSASHLIVAAGVGGCVHVYTHVS